MMLGLERYANDKRFLENLNNGLIIQEAFYGGEDTINRIYRDPNYRPIEPLGGNMENYAQCQAVDITNLLQIMISNGRLLINREFNSYPGLVNPSITDESKKAIYMKVKYRGLERSFVICPEDVNIIIPRDIF